MLLVLSLEHEHFHFPQGREKSISLHGTCFWRLEGLCLPGFQLLQRKLLFLEALPLHITCPICCQCGLLFGGPGGQELVLTAMTHSAPMSESILRDCFVPQWNPVIWTEVRKVTQ